MPAHDTRLKAPVLARTQVNSRRGVCRQVAGATPRIVVVGGKKRKGIIIYI